MSPIVNRLLSASVRSALAEVGHDVTCADVDAQKVHLINQGWPDFENGLDTLLKRNVGMRLWATWI